MPQTVHIEKLAPTGEGIARTAEGVGFVEGALPGELVATNVYQVKKKFWRGRVVDVVEPSPERVGGRHADCAGCDWAFFEESAARRAKRELFLETMRRLGGLGPERFGELPVAASPPGYRLRLRLHAAGIEVGYFAPRTHRVVTAAACEAIAPATRQRISAIAAALQGFTVEATEVAILEDIEGAHRACRTSIAGSPAAARELAGRIDGFDGVRVLGIDGAELHESGDTTLAMSIGGREFRVSVDSFFQGNRHLAGVLSAAVTTEARRAAEGLALDAFGGVGLFAGALLEAGHRVVSVESDAGAAADAAATFAGWPDAKRCEAVERPLDEYLRRDTRRFECVVADPPRAGLGRDLARDLAKRAEEIFVYVSCDPATLARDLPAILEEGFAIRHAALFDLFAFTHRVEALVSLERTA